jgi:carbamate kinase
VELEVIRSLVARKVVVISTGGGGIPVMRVGGQLQGLEAVIDKDRASALLAAQLHVDVFAISTDTDYVYLNYKKPDQTPLSFVTVSQLEEYHRAGHFPPGNMGPKIESVIHFLGSGGKQAVISSVELLCDAVAGHAGTRIVGDAEPRCETKAQELEEPVLR